MARFTSSALMAIAISLWSRSTMRRLHYERIPATSECSPAVPHPPPDGPRQHSPTGRGNRPCQVPGPSQSQPAPDQNRPSGKPQPPVVNTPQSVDSSPSSAATPQPPPSTANLTDPTSGP